MSDDTKILKNPIGLKDFLTSIDETNGYFINSFYELEFSFLENEAAEEAAEEAKKEIEKPNKTNEFNKNFKCRCTNISIPDFRKNFTSIKYNGITVEVEQNLEFNHDLSLTIINDKYFTILHEILSKILHYEYTGTNEPFYQGTSLRNITCNINVYSIVDGICIPILKLNDFKIKSINGLTFDQSDNSISKINIQGSIINYEFLQKKD